MGIGAEVVPPGTPLGTIANLHKIAPCLHFASAPEPGPRQSLRHDQFCPLILPLSLVSARLASVEASTLAFLRFSLSFAFGAGALVSTQPSAEHLLCFSFRLLTPRASVPDVCLRQSLRQSAFCALTRAFLVKPVVRGYAFWL